MPIWKMNFCSRFLRLSVVPRCIACEQALFRGGWASEERETAFELSKSDQSDLTANMNPPRKRACSQATRCRERPQIAMCFLEWLGRLKWRATGLDTSLSFFSTSRRCSRNRSPSRLPVSPMYNLLHNAQVMQ